jgi:hypothetical protein
VSGYHTTTLADLTVGDRVELHPATDTWMSGDRFGTVVKLGRLRAHVKMDRSGRTLSLLPTLLQVVS